MIKAIEHPKVGALIGAGAMSTSLLDEIGSVSMIICTLLGGLLTILVACIHIKKNARGKKRHEMEMELIRKKIEHEEEHIKKDKKG